MPSLSDFFSWGETTGKKDLPVIFSLELLKDDFVAIDINNIYTKILTDVIERTEGIPEQYYNSLWDNCLQSENSEGLVTMLSGAMTNKKDLFLVYDRATKLLRHANNAETIQIKTDYKERGESQVGTYISFKKYQKTDMIKVYSVLEYCAIASLNKNMNLSKAIQIKMSDLRAGVSLGDNAEVKAQALAIAEGLKNGKDVLTDVKDMIETATPDLTATEKAMQFINERRSFYLGLPSSYVTGEAPAGLGDSGEGDAKAIERGLKNYYFSIIKPVVESVFGIRTSFKTEDFRMLSTSLTALQTFELVSDQLISAENKLKLINKFFGFPEGTKGDEPKVDEGGDNTEPNPPLEETDPDQVP